MSIYKMICKGLATGFGSGLLPKMPGTWGSLLACAMVPFVPIHWVTLVGLLLFSWLVIHEYERQSKTHDASHVVIDEIAGIFVCFYAVPISMWTLCIGFILFRIFDITKPLFIGWADRSLPGAWGVLLDDVFAGIVTCLLLHAAMYGGVL